MRLPAQLIFRAMDDNWSVPYRDRSVPLALLLTCLSMPGQAQHDETTITTRHQALIAGKALAYTAKAGLIPIRDNDTGEVHANMFYVAYTFDRPTGSRPRPLTFLWNGGPGSNAGLVHMLGFGPKRIAVAVGDMPRFSPSGTALIDNQDTWLAFTDLIFVDPVGTGYSRPIRPEYSGDFYQSRGDAESVAEFIRVYRLRADAYEAPLYLMGESYGVTRCALVAEALERRHTNLAGVVMLSGGFPLGDMAPALRAALGLPTLTAAAWYHKKLSAGLQGQPLAQVLRAAEDYARGDYAAALALGEGLSSGRRDEVAAQLASFTGIPASQIDRTRLAVPIEQFSVALLADRNLAVGRYDSRLTGPRDPSPQYDPTTDPSLKDILDNVSVIRYLRNELGYQSDLFYQGPFGGGYPPPPAFRGDWMSVRWNRSGAQPSPAAAFQSAMTSNPNLRVMVVSGIFDLVSGYFAIEQEAAGLPADLARRVVIRTYAGGHAIYTDDTVRHQFRVDAARFFQEAPPR
jgi:carboxypeptidase C (cathepsin A)